MPKNVKDVKATAPEEAGVVKSKDKKTAKTKAKAVKPKTKKTAKPKAKKAPKMPKAAVEEQEQMISSETLFEGPLFSVVHDKLLEPGGRESERDIIHHHGSVVILALDRTKNKRDPWVVMERQYRHAARQFLWELPAGKLDKGEDAMAGAQRELAEETGYSAKRWRPFLVYYASPGFLGESMQVFMAEGLIAGAAHPEDDEQIDFRLVKLSDALKMIDKGAILDGKTLCTLLFYARKIAGKRK